MRRSILGFISVLALALLTISGCGDGSGTFTEDAKATGDTFLVFAIDDFGKLQPVTGATTTAVERRLAFRRVRAAVAKMGRPDSDNLVEADEIAQPDAVLREYLICTTELTQSQWSLMAQGLAWEQPWVELCDTGTSLTANEIVGPERPAVGMTCIQAMALFQVCAPAGWSMRLPTAQEWEYAALSGKSRRFSWGDVEGDDVVDKHANLRLRTAASLRRAQDVAKRLPNDFGLYDMHGNVWEMTSSGENFLLCGGAWDQPVMQSRATNRMAVPADIGLPTVGVRLVLVRE